MHEDYLFQNIVEVSISPLILNVFRILYIFIGTKKKRKRKTILIKWAYKVLEF